MEALFFDKYFYLKKILFLDTYFWTSLFACGDLFIMFSAKCRKIRLPPKKIDPYSVYSIVGFPGSMQGWFHREYLEQAIIT